jgi:hypothetical protein
LLCPDCIESHLRTHRAPEIVPVKKAFAKYLEKVAVLKARAEANTQEANWKVAQLVIQAKEQVLGKV